MSASEDYEFASFAVNGYESESKDLYNGFWAELFGSQIKNATENPDLAEVGENLLRQGNVEGAKDLVTALEQGREIAVEAGYINQESDTPRHLIRY